MKNFLWLLVAGLGAGGLAMFCKLALGASFPMQLVVALLWGAFVGATQSWWENR